MVLKGVLKSIFKLFLVVIISILAFIVGIPLIATLIDKGYGSVFVVAMLSILIVAVIIDQVRRFIK